MGYHSHRDAGKRSLISFRFRIALSLLLTVAACGPTERPDLAECRMQAIKVYPHSGYESSVGEFTTLCMVSKGYIVSGKCPVDDKWSKSFDLDCYQKVWPWE